MSAQQLREYFLENESNSVGELVNESIDRDLAISGLTESEAIEVLAIKEELEAKLDELESTLVDEGVLSMMGGAIIDALTFKELRVSFTATNFEAKHISRYKRMIGRIEDDILEFIDEAPDRLEIGSVAGSIFDPTGRGGIKSSPGLAGIVHGGFYKELIELAKKTEGRSSFKAFTKLFKSGFVSSSSDLVLDHYGANNGEFKKSDLAKIVKSDFKRIIALAEIVASKNDGEVGTNMLPARVLNIVPAMITSTVMTVRNIVRLAS